MSKDEIDKLTNCCISKVSKKNCIGQTFVARVISCVDADTVIVSRYQDGFYCTITIRVEKIDTAEVTHAKGGKEVSAKEEDLGTLAKNAVLHWFLPEHFVEDSKTQYDWRKQRPIFDANPVLIDVYCPETCVDQKTGKTCPLKVDPYSRVVGRVTKHDSEDKESLSDMLLRRKLCDSYDGGTKQRTFMKEDN
jgi:endonuclease YncB( thermonuclease family)